MDQYDVCGGNTRYRLYWLFFSVFTSQCDMKNTPRKNPIYQPHKEETT